MVFPSLEKKDLTPKLIWAHTRMYVGNNIKNTLKVSDSKSYCDLKNEYFQVQISLKVHNCSYSQTIL
jgi:hypothetical protein